MTVVLAFLRGNWKGGLVGLALGAGAAWFLKPDPQPAIALKVDDTAMQAGTSTGAIHRTEAPLRKTTREFAKCPEAPGAPPTLVRETVLDRGPVVTDTQKTEQHVDLAEHKLDLTVIPQSRADWAVQIGMEDLLGKRTPRAALRRRLFGPFWAEVAVQPRTHALGAGLAMEW